jgi:RNA polymerase sigma-70 factor (ECF subfamily)
LSEPVVEANEMDTTTDPDLVITCQTAPRRLAEAAFSELVKRHLDMVHRACARVIGDAEAPDAAQEALLSAHRGLARFRNGARFSTWLYRIAVHAAINQRRRRRDVQELKPEAELIAHGGDPIASAMRSELGDLVREGVSSLPALQRRVLRMRYFENLPYEVIAARLGVPTGTVKSRLHRAHAALAVELQHLADEEAA